jgi:hypothetical protein
MSLRLAAGLGLIAALLPGNAAAQEASGDPAANWAAIISCASLAGEARHQCMDGVLQRTGVISDARVVGETRSTFGMDRPERQRSPAASVEPARANAPQAPVASATPRIDEITTTIALISNIGYQRIRVTTAEGSVWDQTQAKAFTSAPRIGDAFLIERSPLGGFLCRYARASFYRCGRTR